MLQEKRRKGVGWRRGSILQEKKRKGVGQRVEFKVSAISPSHLPFSHSPVKAVIMARFDFTGEEEKGSRAEGGV